MADMEMFLACLDICFDGLHPSQPFDGLPPVAHIRRAIIHRTHTMGYHPSLTYYALSGLIIFLSPEGATHVRTGRSPVIKL